MGNNWAVYPGYQARDINVGELGFSIVSVSEGVKQGTKNVWIGWDIVGLPNNTPFQDESRTEYAKDGAAEQMQIKPNDVLLAVNGVEITSVAQLQDLMTKGPAPSARCRRH